MLLLWILRLLVGVSVDSVQIPGFLWPRWKSWPVGGTLFCRDLSCWITGNLGMSAKKTMCISPSRFWPTFELGDDQKTVVQIGLGSPKTKLHFWQKCPFQVPKNGTSNAQIFERTPKTPRNTPQNGGVDIWIMHFHFRASIKPNFENC